jgi:hypothetical protein
MVKRKEAVKSETSGRRAIRTSGISKDNTPKTRQLEPIYLLEMKDRNDF